MNSDPFPPEDGSRTMYNAQPACERDVFTSSAVLPVSQPFKDLDHGVGDGLDHFVVMVVEGHLDIQTHELCQVPMCVGVLCSENWESGNTFF